MRVAVWPLVPGPRSLAPGSYMVSAVLLAFYRKLAHNVGAICNAAQQIQNGGANDPLHYMGGLAFMNPWPHWPHWPHWPAFTHTHKRSYILAFRGFSILKL